MVSERLARMGPTCGKGTYFRRRLREKSETGKQRGETQELMASLERPDPAIPEASKFLGL